MDYTIEGLDVYEALKEAEIYGECGCVVSRR